ncbi:MAG: hypothetical protein GY806_14830 [Gammaproteobacteria bacterium]|nr:hypothetical protein [Gammaproteobacteria bacterium]
MNTKDKQFLKHVVNAVSAQLIDIVTRIGGNKAKQETSALFKKLATESNFELTDRDFYIEVGESNWSDGKTLLGGLMDHVSAITGTKIIEKELSATLQKTEKELGTNLYEVYFRLGVDKLQ